MFDTATTTAWGDADMLDVALDRIVANHADVRAIELSIGARPVPNPAQVLEPYRDRGIELIAHHTAPIGDGYHMRPDLRTAPHVVAAQCAELGIVRFTGHPPHRRFVDWDGMIDWSFRWAEVLAEFGISFAVETMYRPRDRNEVASTGGYHLATPFEVWEFCRAATDRGWGDPLLIDTSHLNIGWHGGDWTVGDIDEVLRDAPCAEIHVSVNDGRRDLHSPAGPADQTWLWAEPYLDRFRWVVDEGRRPSSRSEEMI